MDNKPSEISILPSEERARAEERIAQPAQEWTDLQLNELVMDLRVAVGNSSNIHRKFYDLLKPWFDAHKAALAAAEKEIRAEMANSTRLQEKAAQDLKVEQKSRDGFRRALEQRIGEVDELRKQQDSNQ